MTAAIIHIDLDAIDTRLHGGDLWGRGWGTPTDPSASTCLHGAIRYCQPVPGDAQIIEQVGNRFGFGTGDNDNAGSWADIRAKVVPDITDDMLAGTFGPQWEAIVALARRAATLTPDEAERLDAARDAAGAAAGALVVRDLIGQHGFTQEHYDLLTAPWATVIGRVHPDDADRMVTP